LWSSGSSCTTRRADQDYAADPQGFHSTQHDFIQHKFYDVQMQRLQGAGIDLSQRGAAVQDMLWSTLVQFRGLTKGIVQGALAGKDLATMSDVDIVSAVQDHKRDHNSTLFASSRALWTGLLARGLSAQQIEQLGLAAVRHLEAMPGQNDAQQFLVSNDGQRIAVRHASGQMTEFGVQDALRAPEQTLEAPAQIQPRPAPVQTREVEAPVLSR
jgi:hypothetical protein